MLIFKKTIIPTGKMCKEICFPPFSTFFHLFPPFSTFRKGGAKFTAYFPPLEKVEPNLPFIFHL